MGDWYLEAWRTNRCFKCGSHRTKRKNSDSLLLYFLSSRCFFPMHELKCKDCGYITKEPAESFLEMI